MEISEECWKRTIISLALTAKDIMTQNPKMVKLSDMVVDAFNTMENHSITQMVVLDNGEYKGVLHIHDILKEGIV